MIPPPWINEEFTTPRIAPAQMDMLWAQGWRHFGKNFFRYSVSITDSGLEWIIPLRLDPATFSPGKSHRRILRTNADVEWEILPASLSAEVCELFDRHKSRFTSNVPESLAVFLGEDPHTGPCDCLEFRCRIAGQLVAASFLDTGAASVSSVYAVFDPGMSRRSLGILTMLREIEWAADHGMKNYYPGYTSLGPGVYDYKKRFRPLQKYDWATDRWMPWSWLDDVVQAD